MRTIRAEWTKLRTVRSTGWLILGLIGSTIGIAVMIMLTLHRDLCPEPVGCEHDFPRLSLAGVYLGQGIVVVLAVLAMTTEYGTTMIRTTLAATPRRGVVLAAKATVVTALALGGGVLGVLGSLVASRLILPAHGFTRANGYPPLSLTDESTLRAAGGTVLYLGLIALLSLGIAVTLRDTAVSLTTVLAALYAFPVLASLVNDPAWQERILKYSPMTAGLAIQATRRLDTLPIGPWQGLGLLAGYAAAAVVLGAAAFRLRDA